MAEVLMLNVVAQKIPGRSNEILVIDECFVWNLLTLRSVLNESHTFGEDMSDNTKTSFKTDDGDDANI